VTDAQPQTRGLAAERTALAWHRTAIAALVGEAAAVKSTSSAAARIVISVALLGLMVGCEVGSWYRGRTGGTPLRSLPDPAFRAIGISVLVIAAGAFALALVPSN
jgi:uncharacterized membrane protein YidH (DUF202 family)